MKPLKIIMWTSTKQLLF